MNRQYFRLNIDLIFLCILEGCTHIINIRQDTHKDRIMVDVLSIAVKPKGSYTSIVLYGKRLSVKTHFIYFIFLIRRFFCVEYINDMESTYEMLSMTFTLHLYFH